MFFNLSKIWCHRLLHIARFFVLVNHINTQVRLIIGACKPWSDVILEAMSEERKRLSRQQRRLSPNNLFSDLLRLVQMSMNLFAS